ncbi:TPA: hypothetical protein JH963_002764 [Acinetobacter baumannii]|nr:hypothetical protein [Acinetobacter baumannii]
MKREEIKRRPLSDTALANLEPESKEYRELDRNYKGKIIFNDAALQHVRVNAVLPLDQTTESLKLLATVFPDLKIKQITPFVVMVSLK